MDLSVGCVNNKSAHRVSQITNSVPNVLLDFSQIILVGAKHVMQRVFAINVTAQDYVCFANLAIDLTLILIFALPVRILIMVVTPAMNSSV